MNKKGFVNIVLLIIAIAAVAGISGYIVLKKQVSLPQPAPIQNPISTSTPISNPNQKPLSKISNPKNIPKTSYPISNFSISEYGWAFGDKISEININSTGPITGYEWDIKKIEGVLNDNQKSMIQDIFSEYDILHLESTKTRVVYNLVCDGGGGLSVKVEEKTIWSGGDGCGECYPKKSCEFSSKLGSLVSEIVKGTYTNVSACTAPSCFSLVASNTKNPALCSSLTGSDKEHCLSESIKQAQKPSYCFEYYKEDSAVESCLREVGKVSPEVISETTIDKLCQAKSSQPDGRWIVDSCYDSWAILLMNTKYCFKMNAYGPNGCIHSVATVKKDPEICNLIQNDSRARDACYANLAALKGDIELCKVIQWDEQRRACESALSN